MGNAAMSLEVEIASVDLSVNEDAVMLELSQSISPTDPLYNVESEHQPTIDEYESTPEQAKIILVNIRQHMQNGTLKAQAGARGVEVELQTRLNAALPHLERRYGPVVQDAGHELVRKYLLAQIRLEQITGLQVSDETTAQAVAAYLHDVAVIRHLKIRQPEKIALYQDPEILTSVLTVAGQRSDALAPSQALAIICKTPKDPLRAITSAIARFDEFRTITEPKLREQYGYQGNWCDSFIRRVVIDYEAPAKYFQQWFENYELVATAFPNARTTEIDALLQDKGLRVARVIEVAAQEPVVLTLSEQQRERGNIDLERIRHARREARIPIPRQYGWHEHELARHLSVSINLIDELRVRPLMVANFILGSVRHFNSSLNREDEEISAELPNLISMAVSYLEDLQQYYDEIGVEKAEIFAKALSYRQYTALLAEYQILTGMKTYQLNEIMRSGGCNPEARLRDAATTQDGLRKSFAGQLTEADICRITHFTNADPDRALAVANIYAQKFQISYEKLKTSFPWLQENFAKAIFLTSHQPESDICEWANSVIEAMDAGKGSPYITHSVCKVLVSRNRRTDPTELTTDYLKRAAFIKAEAREAKLNLPDSYIIKWAITSPEKYKESVAKHLAAIAEYQTYISNLSLDEEIDGEIISKLAFQWSNLKRVPERVALFLHNRSQLRRDTEFNFQIESWMLDEAALSNKLETARKRLPWIAALENYNKTITDRYMNQTTNKDGEQYDRLANSADPQTSADPTKRSDMAMMIDTWLDVQQAAAVKLIFNLPSEHNETQLTQDLGVEDLEAYVYATILPKLQRKMEESQQL